jgi:hypothetical protein
MVADDGVNEGGEGMEIGDIERTDVQLAGDSCGGCGPLKSITAAQVTHRGDDPESGLGQFD